MTFYTTDRDGITEINPPPFKLKQVLQSLLEDRDDHGEVWLTHTNSGWQATVFANGTIHLESEKGEEPVRELKGASLDTAFSVWQSLSSGEIDQLKARPWSICKNV